MPPESQAKRNPIAGMVRRACYLWNQRLQGRDAQCKQSPGLLGTVSRETDRPAGHLLAVKSNQTHYIIFVRRILIRSAIITLGIDKCPKNRHVTHQNINDFI